MRVDLELLLGVVLIVAIGGAVGLAIAVGVLALGRRQGWLA